MIWLAVALGGALGSIARHGVNILFSHRLLRLEPYGTPTVNVLGSLAIGVLAGTIASGRLHLSPEVRTFLFVGILGGFTTFSSLMLDTLTLAHGARPTAAMLNVLGQVLVGYLVVYIGFRLGV